MKSEIVHYEIPAKNAEKLSKFYSAVFGWKFKDSGMTGMKYWLIKMGSESKGFLASGGMYNGQKGARPVNYIGTTNIDATIRKFAKTGGKIVQKKVEIPGMGWSAQGVDPEGNPVGMFQPTMRAPPKRRSSSR